MLRIFITCILCAALLAPGLALAEVYPYYSCTQEEKFNKLDRNLTELTMWLGINVEKALHPAIGRLTNLKKLELEFELESAYEGGVYVFEFPPEFFSLPHLEDLAIYEYYQDKITPRYSTSGKVDPEKSLPNLKKLTLGSGISRHDDKNNKYSEIWGYRGDITFLNLFNKIEELTIWSSSWTQLPDPFYEYQHLKKIIYRGFRNIVLDERLCALSELEELHFTENSVSFPQCLSRLKKLKTAKVYYCGNATQKYNGRDYHFPVQLLDLPNLESLTILYDGYLELPPNFNQDSKLKELIIEYPDIYSQQYPPAMTCPRQESGYYLEGDLYLKSGFDLRSDNPKADFNLDNIVTYTRLENVRIEDMGKMAGGRSKFIKWIEQAYRSGVLPNLKEFWVHDDPGEEEINRHQWANEDMLEYYKDLVPGFGGKK